MHNHSHQSESPHLAATSRRPLLMTLLIVLVVMVAEVIGGILSNSLALLGDAGHMLVDALALALSIAAITMARRPATRTRTYGYHRMEILAALANGLTVGLVAFYIFYEAYQRFLTPPTVKPSLMILVATVGLMAYHWRHHIFGRGDCRRHRHFGYRLGYGRPNYCCSYWDYHSLGCSSIGLGISRYSRRDRSQAHSIRQGYPSNQENPRCG